jgi:hypothetical protein
LFALLAVGSSPPVHLSPPFAIIFFVARYSTFLCTIAFCLMGGPHARRAPMIRGRSDFHLHIGHRPLASSGNVASAHLHLHSQRQKGTSTLTGNPKNILDHSTYERRKWRRAGGDRAQAARWRGQQAARQRMCARRACGA